MDNFIKIDNLSCGYAEAFSLGSINFTLPKGTFAGIIGPNGSGKTTLFRGMAGDIPLKSGSISLNDINLSHLTNKQRAQKMAIVCQFSDIGDLTVEDYVLLGRLPYRKAFQFFESENDYAIAEKYMRLTNTYNLKSKLMKQLSGGEQQLAAIAQALTQEPELLLLDEPTSHLDITHQVQVLNLLQRLNHEMGLTVLMIIHDLNLASEYCDYLLMMKDGNLYCQGTPFEVLTYHNIEQVYSTLVITQINPNSGKPAIFLVSERMRQNIKQQND
ncbi:MAG: ABC transporter ATP-binding protein [Bacteroidales bacterium]